MSPGHFSVRRVGIPQRVNWKNPYRRRIKKRPDICPAVGLEISLSFNKRLRDRYNRPPVITKYGPCDAIGLSRSSVTILRLRLLNGIYFDVVKDAVPHHRTTGGVPRFRFPTTVDAVSGVGDRAKSGQGDRFPAGLAITVDTTLVSRDGLVDGVQLATLGFD